MSVSRVLSVEFAAVDFSGTIGTLSLNHSAQTYSLNAQTSKLMSDLPAVHEALNEFEDELASSADPVTDTTKTLPSGQTIVLDPVAQTFRFGGAPAVPVSLGFALRDALTDHGIVTFED